MSFFNRKICYTKYTEEGVKCQMCIFLPFTTLRNLRSSSFFTIFLCKKFYEEIALPILSWRPSSLFSWPLWSSISIYLSSSSRACCTIFTICAVLFFYSALTEKKKKYIYIYIYISFSSTSSTCVNFKWKSAMHFFDE